MERFVEIDIRPRSEPVRGLDAVLIQISQYSIKSLDTFPAPARECERLGKVAGNFSFREAYEVETNA